MSKNTIYALVALVILAILILFGLNFYSSMDPKAPAPTTSSAANSNSKELRINKNQVKGMAVEKEGKIYNLNMKQQAEALAFLDRAEPVDKKDYPNKDPKIGFNRIIVYRFNLPDIIITPITHENKNLVFEIPQLSTNSYMMEFSGGEFTNLIQKVIES